jgi:hypothetical protein
LTGTTIHRRSAPGSGHLAADRSRTTESRPGARSCELFAGNVPLSHATERSLQRRPENRTAWDASARAFVSRAAWWPPLSRRSVLELGRRDSRRESLLWRLGRTQRIRASRACSAPACSKNAASFRGAVQGREEMLEQLKAHDDIERSIVERQYRCVLDYLCVEPPLRASATACSLRPSRAPAPGRPRAPGPARDRSWERRRCPIRCDGQPHPSGTLPWLPVAVASERPRPRSRPDPSKVISLQRSQSRVGDRCVRGGECGPAHDSAPVASGSVPARSSTFITRCVHHGGRLLALRTWRDGTCGR